jgi:hypothetical protein
MLKAIPEKLRSHYDYIPDIRKQNDLKLFGSNKAKQKGLKQDRKEFTQGVNN